MKIQVVPNRPRGKKVGNDLSTMKHTNCLIIADCSIDFWELTDFLESQNVEEKETKYLGRNRVSNNVVLKKNGP